MKRELTHGSLFSGVEGFGLDAAHGAIFIRVHKMLRPMKKIIAVIAVLLLLVGCTVVQTAADSIQRNFKLQQLEYGLSLKDSLILK